MRIQYIKDRCDTARIGFIFTNCKALSMRKYVTNNRVEARGPGRPRSEKARKAVIRNTLKLLERLGFNELTIEAVAARPGVGKATVYRWWANKAELVIDAFVSAVDEELRFPVAPTVMESIHKQMSR